MSKKLLLADDSITIQKVIGITFAHEDYALEIVDNGEAALEKAQKECPDLVLADVYMPGKNGYELCEAIKSDASLAGVPVLLLTGTFEPFDEERARSVGADDWIAKPFESQALIDKVEDLLAKGGQAAQAEAPPEPAAQGMPEPAQAAEAVSQAESAAEEEADFESLLATPDEDLIDEPMTWASEPEGAAEDVFEEETGFEKEFETADEKEDLWGSVSLEEESLMDEFAEEEPVGEDLWGSLNEELVEAESESGQAQRPVSELELSEEGDGEDEVFPLEETDILEAEELPESEEEEFIAFGEGAEEFGEATETVEEELAFKDDEDLFLSETSEEPSVEDSLVSPAEALAEEEMTFEDLEEEEKPTAGSAGAAERAESAEAMVENQVQALSEEDLNRIVEQVAARVLEKIAWEVVPDLAENMIKEEIRKIKAGAE